MYYALYTHRNSLVYESPGEEEEKLLGYSATDVIDEVVKRADSSVFHDLIRYNGSSVNGALLENGYKAIFVGAAPPEELSSILQEMREKVLRKEYTETHE